MTEPTALDILKAARAKIANPNDWGQGMRSKRENARSCCASEAIEEAIPLDIWSINLGPRKQAFRAIRCAAGIDDLFNVPNWNDAPERTHWEVIAAFDLAIAMLRLS